MMDVFIAVRETEYQPSDILGVFATIEEARAFAAEQEKKNGSFVDVVKARLGEPIQQYEYV